MRCFKFRPKIMIDKRILAGILLLIGLVVGVYFVYFKHGPAEDIMAQNKAKRLLGKNGAAAAVLGDYYYYSDVEELSAARKSMLKWEHWIVIMDHTSIGELYNMCDESDNRIMLGKTVMLPDPINGGVMSRTFLNVTLDVEVTGGEMYIECQYNGKDLYSNHWDLCTVEEGMPDQVIFCPIAPGMHKFVKDLDIPNFLPKGRYSTKAWMTNQNDDVIGCAHSDFTL